MLKFPLSIVSQQMENRRIVVWHLLTVALNLLKFYVLGDMYLDFILQGRRQTDSELAILTWAASHL